MPNPGAVASLQAFDKETINTVIQIPDYWLRQRLALQHREAVVVEAFVAFDEMFYLQLRWGDHEGKTYPELWLSSVGAQHHKLMLDVSVQSPQFTHANGDWADTVVNTGANPQWSPCTWSTPTRPTEVQRPSSLISMRLDVLPTLHNELSISLDQTVMFTIIGNIWELDDAPVASLHCKSFRTRVRESSSDSATPNMTARMIENVAETRGEGEIDTDIQLVPDEAEEDANDSGSISPAAQAAESIRAAASSASGADASSSSQEGRARRRGAGRAAHAFVLQAQSPVFRRMLATGMTESTDRIVHMAGVSPQQLDDLLEALYGFGVPTQAREDDGRLLALLSAADRYEILALRDECAALLEPRVCEYNMQALLKAADMHHATALRDTVLGFIAGRLERVAAVMDCDDPAVRRSVREYLAAAESCSRKHLASADIKPAEVTLTV